MISYRSETARKAWKLTSVILDKVDIAGCRLDKYELIGVKARDAKLSGAKLDSCQMADSDFEGLEGRKSHWTGVGLSGVSLRRAQHDGSKFWVSQEKEQPYTPPDFSEASLVDAKLGGHLEGAKFTNTTASSRIAASCFLDILRPLRTL